jgi:hypothetical protein
VVVVFGITVPAVQVVCGRFLLRDTGSAKYNLLSVSLPVVFRLFRVSPDLFPPLAFLNTYDLIFAPIAMLVPVLPQFVLTAMRLVVPSAMFYMGIVLKTWQPRKRRTML